MLIPKILITTSSFDIPSNEILQKLIGKGFEIVQNPYGRRLTEQEAADLLQTGVVGMIAGLEPLTREVLMAARDLRVISRCGIGMDNVDIAAAGERSILVKNTPDAPAVAVAELTVGLMLNLLRRVSEADRCIRSNRWKKLMGSLLGAQTVGLIGYGRIGGRVASLLKPFGSRILVHDTYVNDVDESVELCSLDDIIEHADIISLHIPYDPKIHHFINSQRLNRMKKGALLINASRGGLVDEAALVVALESGQLAGAALDCFEVEPCQGPLSGMDQVVLTAHMGSYAQEARELMEREAAENLYQGLIQLGCVENKVD